MLRIVFHDAAPYSPKDVGLVKGGAQGCMRFEHVQSNEGNTGLQFTIDAIGPAVGCGGIGGPYVQFKSCPWSVADVLQFVGDFASAEMMDWDDRDDDGSGLDAIVSGLKWGRHDKIPTTGATSSRTTGATSSPTTGATEAPLSIDETPPPSVAQTHEPTKVPTLVPTLLPTVKPTSSPTSTPTLNPTSKPTTSPTLKPSSAPVKPPACSKKKANLVFEIQTDKRGKETHFKVLLKRKEITE